MAWFYILLLKSGGLYVGTTGDLQRRYAEHCSGKACRTTRVDPPVEMAYSEQYESISEAQRREKQVKKWSRAKKEALVTGDMEELRRLATSRD